MGFITGRILHYVFKVTDRKLTAHFYRNILGMKVLRHEEFDDGCKAACNGPYDNRWSKTMIGYGPEDNNFVIELTYNYPVNSYTLGNDFVGITIKSTEILDRAKNHNWPVLPGNILEAPDGYKFFIVNEEPLENQDPVEKVSLACSNVEKSIEYWKMLLGLKIFKKSDALVHLGFKFEETKLELVETKEPIQRGTSYGRIAFSCLHEEQPKISQGVKEANKKILTPLVSLDTPGKATVRVIILADVDDHEICFVDDEAFRQLSQFDPKADEFLDECIESDKSHKYAKQSQS